MSREALEDLMDRWLNDPTFREEFRADPAGAVRRSGLTMSADEWESLRADGTLPWDEDLQPRVSRS